VSIAGETECALARGRLRAWEHAPPSAAHVRTRSPAAARLRGTPPHSRAPGTSSAAAATSSTSCRRRGPTSRPSASSAGARRHLRSRRTSATRSPRLA
jgi:hypothetical protein